MIQRNPETPADIYKAARQHFSTARSMHRNLRLGLYQGRNGGGEGASYHVRRAGELAAQLGHPLEGMLWSEHRLAERISENRDQGTERPELQARMTRKRRELRKLAAAL